MKEETDHEDNLVVQKSAEGERAMVRTLTPSLFLLPTSGTFLQRTLHGREADHIATASPQHLRQGPFSEQHRRRCAPGSASRFTDAPRSFTACATPSGNWSTTISTRSPSVSISCSAPARTRRPRLMMITRSQISSTSERIWELRKMVLPSAFRAKMRSRISFRPAGPRPEVGLHRAPEAQGHR